MRSCVPSFFGRGISRRTSWRLLRTGGKDALGLFHSQDQERDLPVRLSCHEREMLVPDSLWI